MLTVAIIGAGPLGRRLALAAARGGLRVQLEDVMPATLHHAQEYIRQQLSASALEAEQPRIRFVSSIEDAVREADLAIDCVPDELESKLEILWLLDRMAPPRMVIATPTTQLSINDLSACTYRPDKCVAIAADARELAQGLESSGESGNFPGGRIETLGTQGGGAAPEITIRVTRQTSAATVAMVGDFWSGVGVTARFEVEPEAGKMLPMAPAPPAG